MEKKLLRVEKVAEIIDAPTYRVYELIRLGLLPAVRLGRQVRVDPDMLQDWIRNGGAVKPIETISTGLSIVQGSVRK